ncbi:MAG: type I glyceraldehyde-3-phosphate dehydrogenase [Acidobacteriota bacterium]
MLTRIGIMGFGRIGRNFFRNVHGRKDLEVAAIVDIVEPRSVAYLLQFDTVHGRFHEPVSVKGDSMYVGGRQIRVLNRRQPGDVDWAELGIDIVIESTTMYRTRAWLEKHLEAGARRVILTVPPKDTIDCMVVMGVNDHELKAEHRVLSIGSATANCLAPIVKILNEAFGIERGFMTTVHAYTNDQRLADVPHTDLRRSRSAAENIIPTETWAPIAVQQILPDLAGRLNGMAMTVPVPDGSTVDLTTWLKKNASVEEVNEAVRTAAAGPLKNIVDYCDEPIVSSDVIGRSHSAIFDSLCTRVLGGNLLKTISWYDNGWGYSSRVVDLCLKLAQFDGKE